MYTHKQLQLISNFFSLIYPTYQQQAHQEELTSPIHFIRIASGINRREKIIRQIFQFPGHRSVTFHTSSNGTSVPMKLKSLTPKADGTQLYRMCLAFEGKTPQKLTAGMNASITLRMASEGQDGTFTLPMHAVFKENGNTYVWTIGKDSLARKVQVALQGMDGNGQAVISSGLKGDEQVVRAGVNALQENEKVRVIHTDSKTNVGGLI